MARKPRIEYQGCLYHVMTRGNNGEFVFANTEEKQMYLDLIRKYKEKYSFKLYAYCILDNHVHILIEQEDTSLSKIMQGIQQSYTQRYNIKYKRTGHVFQQRYKAEICDKDQYLFQLIKYIHNNPVKAGLEGGLNYRWSSHKEYIFNNGSELIDIDYILGLFARDKKRAVRVYKEFMDARSREDEEDIEDYLLKEIRYSKADNYEAQIIDIDKIINRICELEKVNIDEITKRSRIQKYSDIRKAVVLLGEKYTNITSTELANKLRIPLSMVSKIKSGESKRTEYVENIIEKFENKGIIQA
ncbi:MAG: transposase [Tissierellales bacterium]